MANEKRTEERWVDYAARRLEEAGIDLTPYVAVDGLGEDIHERIHKSGIWDLHIGFGGFMQRYRSFLGLKNSGLRPETKLEDLVTESAMISFSDEETCGSSYFVFKGDNVIVDDLEHIIGILGPLDKYGGSEKVESIHNIPEAERTYPAQEFVEDLVLFAKKELAGKPNLAYSKINKFFEYDCLRETDEQRKERENVSSTLQKIHEDVRSLKESVRGNPMSLMPDDKYLERLYIQAIQEDRDNLRFFEFEGETIPYVLTDSSRLNRTNSGNITAGRVIHNLYLIAKDLAPEEWQQKIIAYHESLCAKVGHDEAVRREKRIVKALGKEKEYSEWVKTVRINGSQ